MYPIRFVIFAKRIETNEARLRVFCMTDDREEKTLEGILTIRRSISKNYICLVLL